MANRMVNLRLEGKLLKAIDFEVRQGFWGSRSEFIKDALKAFLEKRKTEALIASLKNKLGEGKRLGLKDSPEEFEKIREEVGRETLRRHGLL
ncbi:type II toxin-antitoxin system ParD family antitoxin [archaeon]|nr:type II toxin-antitoxin system ParD family antitoxin [archaeon]